MNNNYLIEGSDYISINNKISEIIKKNNKNNINNEVSLYLYRR